MQLSKGHVNLDTFSSFDSTFPIPLQAGVARMSREPCRLDTPVDLLVFSETKSSANLQLFSLLFTNFSHCLLHHKSNFCLILLYPSSRLCPGILRMREFMLRWCFYKFPYSNRYLLLITDVIVMMSCKEFTSGIRPDY